MGGGKERISHNVQFAFDIHNVTYVCMYVYIYFSEWINVKKAITSVVEPVWHLLKILGSAKHHKKDSSHFKKKSYKSINYSMEITLKLTALSTVECLWKRITLKIKKSCQKEMCIKIFLLNYGNWSIFLPRVIST